MAEQLTLNKEQNDLMYSLRVCGGINLYDCRYPDEQRRLPFDKLEKLRNVGLIERNHTTCGGFLKVWLTKSGRKYAEAMK